VQGILAGDCRGRDYRRGESICLMFSSAGALFSPVSNLLS
jgi:hypothetical protein